MANGVVRDGVQNLFGFFRKMSAQAKAHGGQSIESYVLALSALDALRYAETSQDARAELFSDFVTQHSGRADIYSKVAVPILFQELRLTKPRTFGAVLECIRREYALDEHFLNHRIRAIGEDPDWNAFWERITARCGNIPPTTEQEFHRLTYAQLLWRHYRTYAIHRLTVRDEAANITGAREPFYMNEQAGFAKFLCGEIGFSCFVKPLMLYGGLGHLTPEIVVDEVSKALGNPELGAPPGIALEQHPTWDAPFSMWLGNLSLQGNRHGWALSEGVAMGWVNFGIPLGFILDTLDACIGSLERACQDSIETATRVWLNYNRRLT
jgi:hypothetical protein